MPLCPTCPELRVATVSYVLYSCSSLSIYSIYSTVHKASVCIIIYFTWVYSLGNKQTQTGQNGDGHTWTYPIRNVLLRCALINTRHDSCFSMESSSVKVDKISLPRENMSLPSNMQLNDLSTLHKGKTLLLRDRCLIRTEAEVSSMVQSNYRTGNSGHFGALGTGICPCGLLYDSVPSVTLLPHHPCCLSVALETAKHHLGDKMREEEEDLSAAYAARGKTGFRCLRLACLLNGNEWAQSTLSTLI